MIKEAIQFLNEKVFEPAISRSDLDPKIKSKVKNTRDRIKQFKKVGDLSIYLSRFEDGTESEKRIVYDAMKGLGLETYEDIVPVFKEKFKYDIDDITTLEDFIIGKEYTSWDISIFARTYNNLSGIYLIGDDPNYKAIFIKATLNGKGKYPNSWIKVDQELKYFLKSILDVFKETYKENRAILNSKGIPIYVFIKEDTICTLKGIFEFTELTKDDNNALWVKLMKIDSFDHTKIITEKEYFKDLDEKIKNSLVDSREKRLQRLKQSVVKPETVQIISTGFRRNPDVVAEVLDRAKGKCEHCKKRAPFLRASDGTPYLEVHHTIPLAKGGEDTVENAVAVCPNCHREAHYG